MTPRATLHSTGTKAKPEVSPQQDLLPPKPSNAGPFPLTGPVERLRRWLVIVVVVQRPHTPPNPKAQEIRAFDKDIVEAVLKKDYKLAASLMNLKTSGVDKEDNSYLQSGARQVRIDWLNPGEEMNIAEYDGDERVVFKRDAV
ncbi:MAG: hypothetical protein Q9207_005373 [Kuettlingeria erythrocarpa]